MKKSDVLFELMTGSPISIGDNKSSLSVFPLTLNLIGEIGFHYYQNLLSSLLLTKESIAKSFPKYREQEGWEFVTDYQIVISNCLLDEVYRDVVTKSLKIFLNTNDVKFQDLTGLFIVDGKVLTESLFNEMVLVLKYQNLIKVKEEEEEKEDSNVFRVDKLTDEQLSRYPPHVQERLKDLIEKRNQGRKNLKEAREKELGMDLDYLTILTNQINYLGIYTRSLSEVLNWTLYQLEEQHKKYLKEEGYNNSFKIYSQHGGEPRELGLDKHWSIPDKKDNKR